MKNVKQLLLIALACSMLMAGWATAEDTVSFQGVTVEKNAAYLDMGDARIQDLDAFERFLDQLPALRQVDMFETPVNRRQIDELTGRFPNIEFGWTIHIAAQHYVRTDATAFSTLHGECIGHSSRDFEVLKYCKNLRALDIGHNDVMDLNFLTSLPRLRVLILADNPIHDLRPLAELKELEYLEVFSCDYADITPLTQLPHLLDLNISNNPNLYQYSVMLNLSPTIKRLWVSGLGVYISDARVRELQSVMPDAIFSTDDHPTANGWRVGEHYETIYEIFHTGEYKPFSDSFPLED